VIVKKICFLQVNYCSRQREVTGKRRSFPKARLEILVPGGYWRRLYSARSTKVITRFTRSWLKPAAI